MNRIADCVSKQPIGEAIEFIDGKTLETACYGTYEDDIPTPDFRWRISFVEHNDSFKMHAHQYWELVIVLSGSAIHLTEFEDHPLNLGDVFVINNETRHGFKQAKNLRLANIMYDPDQFLNGQNDLEKMLGYQALFKLQPTSKEKDRFNERLHLNSGELAYVNSLIATMKSEYENETEGKQVIIRSNFLILITYLSRLFAEQTKKNTTTITQIANVTAFIQKHYHETISVDELAQVAHLSTSQLQRKFKRVFNTSPVQYINNLRLNKACELLLNPNLDVTEIAFQCGFSSSSFFATQFKKYTGQTPTQYRNQG